MTDVEKIELLKSINRRNSVINLAKYVYCDTKLRNDIFTLNN